ncbi:hypothetical protein AARAC_008634 [Aspergillus arachidicola]|uniref:Uncharacterized protein n=1 Tax=Aspergillus arachidicola TaxID=656916 RepID=A0A2G7FTP3_9EURO|nr:hypothetical protein AARAC_008634 [Aspergillus arachidicola]
MKLLSVLASTFLTVAAIPYSSQSQGRFEIVDLPDPKNWVAGRRLFPANVIAGYNAAYDQYDAESWADYVLNKCYGYHDCTSTITFSAINSGTPKDRFWFGYVFRGGPTTPNDYKRDWNPLSAVEDSIAFTTEGDNDIMQLQTQLK